MDSRPAVAFGCGSRPVVDEPRRLTRARSFVDICPEGQRTRGADDPTRNRRPRRFGENAMNRDRPVIFTQALTRDFKSTRAVDSLSIEVPRGIVFGFLGPNGSGKTTTIRMLLGLLEPTSGKAVVLGFDTIQCPNDIRSRCGALLEHPSLYERLSTEDNLQLYARIWGMRDSERSARIREVLESFSLWDRRKEPAGTFSHGMKKKLAVARAMLHRPALLFLDEPTAGMDAV